MGEWLILVVILVGGIIFHYLIRWKRASENSRKTSSAVSESVQGLFDTAPTSPLSTSDDPTTHTRSERGVITERITLQPSKEAEAYLAKRIRRRKDLLRNPPSPLAPGSIRTVERQRNENRYNPSTYPVYYVVGVVGEDYVTAHINCNPRAALIPFCVNGAASDFSPDKYAGEPVFSIKTGKLRIVENENTFMSEAIKQWLRDECAIVKDMAKEKVEV